MRPHKLIMKAFGPFAGETTVDFDAMGNSIYLISGDTGAGKTTIFDGIIYALYGTASGGARSSLGTEAFHSDYAKDGAHRDEMSVELTFSNAGRTYVVSRRMYWGKRGDARTAAKESTLSENGNILVYGKGREDRDDVTARITGILGLDADQFRRIIMLAQGEFQRFLTAKSDERGVILGKLYDNRQHLDFQMRLKAALALLKEQDRKASEEILAQLRLLRLPEDPVAANADGREEQEAERVALGPDHPGLLPALRAIIGRMESELQDLKSALGIGEAALLDLRARYEKGRTCNALLDDLEQQRAALRQREADRERIEELRGLIKVAEAAERVLPFELALEQAENDCAEALHRIRQLEEEGAALSEQAAEAREAAAAAEAANNPRIAELQEKLGALRGILQYYEELEASLQEQKTCGRELVEAEDALLAARDKLAEIRNKQEELGAALQRLAEAGEPAVRMAESRLQACTARKDELEFVQSSVAGVETLAGEAERLARAALKAREQESEAAGTHYQKNRALIEGQAGILADDLREQLTREAEVTCPVCGTKLTAADAAHFAARQEEIPTRQEVEDAYTALQKAHEARKKAEDEHQAVERDLAGQRQALLEKAGRLLAPPGADGGAGADHGANRRAAADAASDHPAPLNWETLAEGTALTEALKTCATETTAAREAYDAAVRDKAAKDRAEEEKARTEADSLAAAAALEEARERQTAAAGKAEAARTKVEAGRARLQGFPADRSAADAEISSLETEAAELRKEIDDTRRADLDLQTRESANRGALESARAEKTAREEARTRAAEAFAAQLTKGGFADAEACHKGLSPEGTLLDRDGVAAWLEEKRTEAEEYDRACRDLDSSIRQLTESTKGMARVDLQAAAEEISELEKAQNALSDQEKQLDLKVQTDRSVEQALRGILRRRAGYDRMYRKLGPLAETADGRYAFSRYVLTGFFHRIVEQANVHLDTMTDGEYLLVPKATGDGRSNVGLDLRVLNTITNYERDTGSLSGGQLFEASLSLALGLSDVVQMESSSNIRIDSMFIDEGFGSLDAGRLDRALEVLQHLSAGKRQIGIISHVSRLDECLPKKIRVLAGERGSSVRIETDE